MDHISEIDEDVLVRADKYYGGDNNYKKALAIGQAWRDCGLTPLYFFDDEEQGIWVVAEEMYGETIH